MATSPVLEQWIQGAESNGNSAIVLDLANLTFIDSSGIHAFLRAADRASRSGRSFSIVSTPAVVQRLLEITRTNHLLGSDQQMGGSSAPTAGEAGTLTLAMAQTAEAHKL